MVKCKAPDIVDDWLREGELAVAAMQVNIEAIPEAVTPLPLPTVEPNTVQVAGVTWPLPRPRWRWLQKRPPTGFGACWYKPVTNYVDGQPV